MEGLCNVEIYSLVPHQCKNRCTVRAENGKFETLSNCKTRVSKFKTET